MRERHHLLQAAHLPDVLLAGEVVDDHARRKEQQRLEERVRHEVEHCVAVRADPGSEEHVADLRHRRVRDHAFDVPLHERDHARHDDRDPAQDRREMLHVGCGLEDRMRPNDEVDACRDHGGGVDESRDRGWAFHRVRKPGVERKLGRLRDRSAEQAERDEVRCGRRQLASGGGGERGFEVERSGLRNQQEETEGQCGIADRVHDERLLRSGDCIGPVVVEADQQVRRQSDEPPAGEQQQQVAAHHEHQHREDEQSHVGEVAALLVLALHVAHRVPDDQAADAGDD